MIVRISLVVKAFENCNMRVSLVSKGGQTLENVCFLSFRSRQTWQRDYFYWFSGHRIFSFHKIRGNEVVELKRACDILAIRRC